MLPRRSLDGRLLELIPRLKCRGLPSSPRMTRSEDAEADPDRFDWSTDDSVLLGEQFATAVYRNKRDAIVIRQEGVGGDDDHFVILRDVDAARLLVGALQREIKGEH